MGNKTGKCKSAINLIQVAQYQYEFLHLITTESQVLDDAAYLRCSIQRYEKYWLPLASEHGNTITPPLDIEWVWQVHMLSPSTYRSDCKKITGKVIDHRCVANEDRHWLCKETEKIWNSTYLKVAFYLDCGCQPEVDVNYTSKITCDLISASNRQRQFIYSVSLPHYRNEMFLKRAEKRYRSMLQLKRENPKALVVPCCDNKFIWQAHQLHPIIYEKETTKFLGKLLNHDDRASGPNVDAYSYETTQLLKGIGEKFGVSGAMFRGTPPLALRTAKPVDYVSEYACKRYTIKIDEIIVKDAPQGYDLTVVFSLAKRGGEEPERVDIATIGSSIKPRRLKFLQNQGKLDLNTELDYGIHLGLVGKDRKGTTLTKSKKYAVVLDHTVLSAISAVHTGIAMELTVPSLDPSARPIVVTVVAHGEKGSHTSHSYRFVNASDGDICLEPSDLRTALSHSDYHLLLSSCQPTSPCQYSDSFLRTVDGKRAFKWRVIHCKKPILSAVEVFDVNDDLVSSGYTIGPSTLPHPKQVDRSSECFTLDPSIQKAMLIRGRSKDWAIIRSSWSGYVLGDHPRRPHNHGKFNLDIISLDSNSTSAHLYSLSSTGAEPIHLKVNHKGIDHCFSLDLENGVITAKSAMPAVPEAVCCCCCVAVLFVLCHPRPPPEFEKETARILPYKPVDNGNSALKFAEMSFLIGAGLYNYYLPKRYNADTIREKRFTTVETLRGDREEESRETFEIDEDALPYDSVPDGNVDDWFCYDTGSYSYSTLSVNGTERTSNNEY